MLTFEKKGKGIWKIYRAMLFLFIFTKAKEEL